MSQLAVDGDIFKWLQGLQIVKQGKRNSQNKVQLGQSISSKFFDGVYISKLLRKIIQSEPQINESLLTKMKSIKQNSTPAIRLYNWNLIVDVLKYYKFTLDYVQKSKILNLQPPPIYKILAYLKGIYHHQNVKGNGEDGKMQNSSSVKGIGFSENNSKVQLSNNPLQVDIKSLQGKTPADAMNIMEFFVISLSRNFKLSPQHTLNLFLDNNKYLALLFVKGIKESFQPILQFENQILASLEFIVLNVFSVQQQKSLQFFFQGLKPLLISKNFQVAFRCLAIFQKLNKIYTENNLDKQHLLSWLRKQGVNTILFSSKRHQDILQQAIQLSYKFMQEQLFQFLRPVQKSPLWTSDTQKLHFYNSFLFVADNHILQQFSTSTCLLQWNKYCLKSLKKLKSTKEIHLLTSILHRMWIEFPQVFMQENGLADSFVGFLKSASFSNDFMLFIDAIKTMFDMMAVLGKRKNNYAPMFYKTLINCLAFQSSQQRVVFIVENFIVVFGEIGNLPGSLLVDPLLRSIERNCTSASLRLCRLLITENKVKQEESIEIIQVMTKVFFEDIYQGPLAIEYVFDCIIVLDQQVQGQFLLRNAHLALSHFYSLSKSLKKTFQELKSVLGKYQQQTIARDGQNSYLTQVKKYLLIQNLIRFLTQIIRKQYLDVMKQLQQPLFMTFLKVKYQLQKQHIANILKHSILRRYYYDVQQELVAVMDQYERRYHAYLEGMNKRSMSMMDSDDMVLQENSIVQSRLYASQSVVMEENSQMKTKELRPDLFKPEKSAIKHLEMLKNKLSRIKVATDQKEKTRDMIQQKKDLVRSIINQRRLVKHGTKYNPDMDYKCLFQFDTCKTQRSINGLPLVQITDLQKQEEDIFVADVDSLMKKYRKVWRFLFFKYSTFGTKNSSELKVQEKINIAEVWKMHREYNADFMKKEEAFAMIRMINENMKRKNDLQNLTYLGFQEYIVQFCIIAYDKLGMTSLSPGQKVSKLISQLKSFTEQKGGNSEIFTNPQQVYFLQTEVIKEYNRRLADNPNYILPQGYKKIKQTQFIYKSEFTQPVRNTFNHQLKKFSYSKSYFDVLEVLNQIIAENSLLGFSIIQPRTVKTQRTLAKPALFQQMNQKLKNHKEGYLLPKRQINSTYIAGREKINPIKPQFHPTMVEFSLGIKLGLSAVPMRHKLLGQQVAYWMDDMLDSVESGLLIVQNKAAKRIQNQAIKNKKRMLFKLKIEMKQKQKFYKQRSQSVKSQFQKIQVVKQDTNKRRIQEMKARQLQQKQRQQKQMKKKLVQFQKAKRFFSQRQQKQKKKLQKQFQIKKVQKQEYKKNVERYFSKKKQQLQQKQLNFKRQKEYQQKKEKDQLEKKKQLLKKVYFTVLKKDEQALQKIQSLKEKYEEFASQSYVQEEFQKHRKSLTLLYQLLLKYQKSKISSTDNNQISLNTLNFFALKFKLVPFVLEKNILTKVFSSIGKGESNRTSSGITYRGFQEVLLKIIVKSKNMLNDLSQRRKRRRLLKSTSSINTDTLQLQDLASQNSSLLITQNSKLSPSKQLVNENLSVDYLFDPEGVTLQTIRQFMLFLNLPDDKLGVEKRFREAIEAKGSKPLLLIKKELKEELARSMVG